MYAKNINRVRTSFFFGNLLPPVVINILLYLIIILSGPLHHFYLALFNLI